MVSDVAYLASDEYIQNEYGIHEVRTSLRKIFVDVSSVGSSEWFEGSRSGLNPTFRFTVFAPDYKGEKVIEYHDTRYTIYRTFLKDTDHIELYTELKKGNE